MASNDDQKKQTPLQRQSDASLENLGMEELLDLYDKKMASFAEGEIIRGRVVKINAGEVVVDIGYK